VSYLFRLNYCCRVNDLFLAVQRLSRQFSITEIVKSRNRHFVLSSHSSFLKIQTFRIQHNESIFVLLAVKAALIEVFRRMKTKHLYFYMQAQAWRLAAKPQHHSPPVTHGARCINKCFVPMKLPIKGRKRNVKIQKTLR
jgi:hypothetical protein